MIAVMKFIDVTASSAAFASATGSLNSAHLSYVRPTESHLNF